MVWSIILTTLSLSFYLLLKSLEENVVYFQSPSEIQNIAELEKKRIRIEHGLNLSWNTKMTQFNDGRIFIMDLKVWREILVDLDS